jgi:hypothetical protein
LLTVARIATIAAALGGFVSSTAFAQSQFQPMPPAGIMRMFGFPFILPRQTPELAGPAGLSRSTSQQGLYSIEGVGLGDTLAQKEVFPTLTCTPSELFQDAAWCLRSRKEIGPKGAFTNTIAFLQLRSGEAYYLARVIAPAFFAPNDFNKEIDRLSNIYGQRANVRLMPAKVGLPNGVIASWGQVTLVPLDPENVQALASGKSAKAGFIVDFLQDFQRSAQEGLPIYVLSGGAGMIWNASTDENGKGKLRISAIDASKLNVIVEPKVAAPPPVLEPQATPTVPLPPEPTPVASSGDESCSAVADPAERLSCYDKAAGNTTPREVPSPSPSPSLPTLPVEPVDFAAVTKAPNVDGSWWVVYITFKDNNINLRNIVINRGSCRYFDSSDRQPQMPANFAFGNVLQLTAHCDPLEILLQSSLGDDTFYFDKYGDVEGGISVSVQRTYGFPMIIISSHVDNISIYNVTVNRGNCDAQRRPFTGYMEPTTKNTNTLLFGQRQWFAVDFKCDPLEVTITTNLGTETFSLK